jgi:hypothetical protein
VQELSKVIVIPLDFASKSKLNFNPVTFCQQSFGGALEMVYEKRLHQNLAGSIRHEDVSPIQEAPHRLATSGFPVSINKMQDCNLIHEI